MRFEGAVIKEQGVTFAIVCVKEEVLRNSNRIQETRSTFVPAFRGIPVILMAQDNRGRATYQGRPDIVNFLASISVQQIPWKEYTLN
jgi:hypothetical protein